MKLPSNQTHIKVPISAIRDTGNVRLQYDEEGIRELAASIRRDGLINAVTVKPPVEDENGIKTYELIAGHRRIRALKYLCEQGDDFSMVECKILTGEMWALQMIENIQRTDLSSRDKEEAISYALSIGLTQTQIAEKLSKPVQYISDIVAGAKIRKIADEHGLDTRDIATKTLSQLRSIPEDALPGFIEQLIREGGTYRVATRMMNAQKQWEESHSQRNPATHVSIEESEQKDIDERFKPGTIISHAGKRLFFKDLYVNKEFVHATAKDSHMYLRVCKITRITDDYIEYTDGDRSCGKAGKKKDVIDSEIEPLIDSWLFDIPPDATMNLTTHVSSENNELQAGGITSVQLRGVIYPTPTNAPVKILWEGQLYNVFAAEYDKTRGAVILAHDPFDVVEVQNTKPSAKTNRAQKIIRNCWQTYCRKNSERTAMGFYQFVLSQIGESN